MPEVSVIVATRNRARRLDRMLRCLERQKLNKQDFEVLVVDNGSCDDTSSVLNQRTKEISLVPLFEAIPGKSHALNQAIRVATGKLLVFTDDDVTFSPEWVLEYRRAYLDYPAATVFCGPIRPHFPPATPPWLRSHPAGDVFFGRFVPGQHKAELSSLLLPCGANFAVRTLALGDIRFRTDLGPGLAHGALYEEDTAFLRVLRQKGGLFMFLPAARVVHHIDAGATKFAFVFEKAFQYGRGKAVAHGQFYSFREESNRLDTVCTRGSRSEFELGLSLHFYLGQLYQFTILKDSRFAGQLTAKLLRLGIRLNEHLLCPSARAVYLDVLENSLAGSMCGVLRSKASHN